MDKQTESRKAFEAKIREDMLFTDEELAWQPERNCYVIYGVHLAWWAWRASRESLAVELPQAHDPADMFVSHVYDSAEVDKAIRAIGIRIKGEGV